jgi:hypothetical protein
MLWVREYKKIFKKVCFDWQNIRLTFFVPVEASVRRASRHQTSKSRLRTCCRCRVTPAWRAQQRWSVKLNGIMKDKRAA